MGPYKGLGFLYLLGHLPMLLFDQDWFLNRVLMLADHAISKCLCSFEVLQSMDGISIKWDNTNLDENMISIAH